MLDSVRPDPRVGPEPSEQGPAASPLRAWFAEDRARAVPDVDFGSRWLDPAAPDRYHRVAWIPTTGELYVTDSAESYVRVLARIPREDDVSAALQGWAAASCRPDAPLRWVEDRVTRWLEGAGD